MSAAPGRIADTRGLPRGSLQTYYEMMVGDLVKGPRSAWVNEWTARQTYIALGNLLTSAGLLGIDACPMEGFDRAQFDEILGLKSKGFASAVIATLGYRSAADKYAAAAKVRFPKEKIITQI